jgi:hypothetical protein
VHRPVCGVSSPPQGATALCNDGYYSFSENADMDETSSRHEGTKQVLNRADATSSADGALPTDQELVESVSSMSLMACAQASIPGTCGLTHHPTTPAASLATPHEPLGSFGLITIDGTPAIARFSI